MPSSMTHTYFSMDVYKEINKKCRNKIKNSLEYYKLFSQGSDPFMFYNFLLGKKSKKISKIQKIMHHEKTRDFFFSIINYISKNKLNHNNEAMAYLYGYICHYYLDLYTHPFLYYKSGIFNKNDKNTYKYNGMHQKIEYGIDLYFIQNRESVNYKKFRVYEEIFDIKNISDNLKGIIDATIGDVYNIDKASYLYEKSIWYMAKFFKLANYDPYGIKLCLYKVLDNILPDSFIKLSELSFYNNYKDVLKWLNTDKKDWYKPWDNSIKYNYSFLELYDMAKREAIITIEEVTKMLDSKIDYNKLNSLFKNLSFATGIDCDIRVSYKYFEY